MESIPSPLPTPLLEAEPAPSTSAACLLVDVENVTAVGLTGLVSYLKHVLEHENVVIARAYGDWVRCMKAKQALSTLGIEFIENSASQGKKNSADMQLTVDAAEVNFVHRHITKFIICTGDRDFVPLARLLRKWGKYVWVLGPTDTASELLKQVVDRFDSLLPPANAAKKVAKVVEKDTAKSPAVSGGVVKPSSPKLNGAVVKKHQPITVALQEAAKWAFRVTQQVDAVLAGQDERDYEPSRPVLLSHYIKSIKQLHSEFEPAQFVGTQKRSHILSAERLRGASLLELQLGLKQGYEVIPSRSTVRWLTERECPPEVEELIQETIRVRQQARNVILESVSTIPALVPDSEAGDRYDGKQLGFWETLDDEA